MAIRRHLGFYQTADGAIRSTNNENPNLEPNMEWIRCTVCEMFAFKLHIVTLKLWVSGSLKVMERGTIR